jgi:predicted N-acetyltransferase YhbS
MGDILLFRLNLLHCVVRWKMMVRLCYLHGRKASLQDVMIHIRPATEADFKVLLQVQQTAFGEYANLYEVSAWTTETLDSLKQDAKEKRILVAEAEGAVIGSVRFWTVAGVCVIRLLSVSPTHQRRGVGKALIQEIERVTADTHKFYACTMLRTVRNIQFFLNLGYKAETVLPNHYHHLDLVCFAKYREPTNSATLSSG